MERKIRQFFFKFEKISRKLRKNIFALCGEKDDEHLSNDHADEHSERIDRGVGNARSVALRGVAGIAECHRIGHRAAENAADGAVVVATGAQRNEADHEHGHDGEQGSQPNPQDALGTHHGLEEVATGIEAEAGQIERETQLAEHQRGRARGVADEVHTRSERTHDDAHDDGAARNA